MTFYRALAVGLAAIVLWGLDSNPSRADDVLVGLGHPFSLRAANGRTVTDKTFSRDVQVVVFGYTSCPDVCPTTLAAVAAGVERLGPAGRHVHILFMSVDPDRDDASTLARFAKAFGPHVIGLTGSKAALTNAARAFHTRYRVAPDERGEVQVAHSGLVYLFARGGRFAKALPPGTSAAGYAQDLARLTTTVVSG